MSQFDNKDRLFYYGLRVGDIVEINYLKGLLKVIEYDQRNLDMVKVEDIASSKFWVLAKKCTIIQKIEDQ